MVRVALPIFALKVRGGNATHSGNKSNVLLYSKSLCSTFDCSQLVEEDGGCFFAPHSRGHRDPPLDDMSEKGKKGHSVCCFPCWVTHGFEKVQVNSRLALTQPEKTSWPSLADCHCYLHAALWKAASQRGQLAGPAHCGCMATYK